jgi:hypothetical protein
MDCSDCDMPTEDRTMKTMRQFGFTGRIGRQPARLS